MLGQRAYLRLRALERGLSQITKSRMEGIVQLQITREGWMERIIKLRFKNERQRTYPSLQWADRKKNYPWPILNKRGWLQRGAEMGVFGTYRLRGAINWNVGKVGVHYAKYHQSGTDKMAARPFFNSPDKKELGPANRRAIQIIAREMRKAFRK